MKKITLNDFLIKAKDILNSNLRIVNYDTMSRPALFECKKHGFFNKTPKNFLLHQCNKCTSERLHELFSKSNDEFLKQVKSIFPNYDYSKTVYYNDESKVIVTCPLHGDFNTTPNRLLNKHECPYCAEERRKHSKTYTLQELIKKAKIIFPNYDYSKADTNGIYNTVEVICPIHGSFFKSWNNHLNSQQGCPYCRVKSKGEEAVRKFLTKNNISFINTKTFSGLKDVNLLSYDFYLPDKNLLIECQGQQHYYNSFNKPLHEFHKQFHHDWLKRKYAKKNGIKLIAIPYWEYKNINNILKEEI